MRSMGVPGQNMFKGMYKDDIGLDYQLVPLEQVVWCQPVFELVDPDVHRTSGYRWVRVLYLMPHQIKKTIHLDGLFYLVDDIGLEPMTFRTSSGCSSQLS